MIRKRSAPAKHDSDTRTYRRSRRTACPCARTARHRWAEHIEDALFARACARDWKVRVKVEQHAQFSRSSSSSARPSLSSKPLAVHDNHAGIRLVIGPSSEYVRGGTHRARACRCAAFKCSHGPWRQGGNHVSSPARRSVRARRPTPWPATRLSCSHQ